MSSRTDRPSSDANAEQACSWNGPEGSNWARHSAERTAGGDLIEPLIEAAAIEPTAQVLDIGCGTGELTRQAARRAHRGSALGIDLSAQMVELARHEADAQDVTNAAFEVGDAQVHPFPSGAFDVCLSHFGTMFFADPTAAFRNIARAVRPRGRVLFVCPQSMDRCDWYTIPLAPLLGHAPDDDSAPSVMFSLADATALRGLLEAAGMCDVHLGSLEQTLWFGADVTTAAESFLGSGPVRAIRDRRPTLSADEARSRLEAVLTPHLTDDGVRLSGAYWLVEATVRP